VLRRSDGRLIPAGWLPDAGPDRLGRFARTAAAVHARRGATRSMAVLSQWNPQYLQLARRIETLLRRDRTAVFRWTADLLLREEMARGLGSGLAAAIYVGHGRPIGWAGYRGTRIHHLASEAAAEPLGVLISLCCRTASRRRTGLSFAEAIPLEGLAAAAVGAVGDTLHTNNTRWAIRLSDGLAGEPASLGSLIVDSLPANPAAATDYRILGDPLAPVLGTDASVARASAVEIHP
jgi:hypothetical protein